MPFQYTLVSYLMDSVIEVNSNNIFLFILTDITFVK